MPHRNAALTPAGRLKLARLIVDDGWPIRRAAERFQVSWPTAARWADRLLELRATGGREEDGLADRSSRPHRSPTRTRRAVVKKVVHLRTTRGWGPARIGPKLGLAVSTVAAVIRREGLPRLCDVDLADRQRLRREVRRYEHAAAGDLVHIDVKKLGVIPDGGGWRFHGRGSDQAKAARPGSLGYGYLHTVLDDHSRLAFTEVLPDEKGTTTAAFWARAHAWFAGCGIRIVRCLSDNGANYRSRDFAAALAATGTVHKRTRPYRPQTNGKVERFHRTLATEWAYARPYLSEAARRRGLPTWLHIYNHHRHHTALGGLPPASRVTNLSGRYN
ncbi:IS481 family transposase [Kineococcus sp. SYSU DK002]|uniref:IS481 family transposase n=1 Tax=Kineococcus sp. SYSU DK002 TaxID=3383123 RepID=UPI003D7ECC0D